MAGPSIILKIGADIRDAVSGLNRVKRDANDAAKSVKEANAAANRFDRQLNLIRSRARTAFGAGTSILGAGGSPFEALAGGLGAAFPESATLIAGNRFAGQFINQALGVKTPSEIQKRVLGATSLAEAADVLVSGSKAHAHRYGFAQGLRSIDDLLRRKPGAFSASRLGGYREKVDLRQQVKALAETDPGFAAAIVAQLGNPPDLVKVLQEVAAAQRTEAQAQLFRAGFKQQGASVTNVYTAFDGLGGRDAVGRQVRSVLDARDRNNGRYVNTSSRR